MKKRLFVILFIIICLPVSVFAKDSPFYKKFQTENFESKIAILGTNYLTKEIDINNYHIIFNENINYYTRTLIIKKYDYNGKFISKSQLENYTINDVTSDNNNIYLLCGTSESLELKKIDSNLNIVKDYVFTEEQLKSLSENNYNNYYNEIMNIKDNLINIFAGKIIFQFNLDLSSSQIISTTENNLKSLFPKIYKASELNVSIYDSNDSYQVFYDDRACEAAVYDEYEDSCTPAVKVYDSNDDFLWKVPFPIKQEDYTYVKVYDVKIIDDYIVVLKNYFNRYSEYYDELFDEKYSDFIIYDFEGNEIQTIEAPEFFYNIIKNSLGFVSSYTEKNECPPQRVDEYESTTFFGKSGAYKYFDCTYNIHEEFYYLYYLINSKVTGNGKIEVSNKSKEGQKVAFKVQADPNYSVKKVTVKDSKGNILDTDNGTFIMPEDDVIIEAEFVTLNNPYTKGGIIALIGIIAITTGSYLIIKRQKLND